MSNRRPRRRSDPRNPLNQIMPTWRWRTLPVWVALTGGFVLGWYVAAVGARFAVDLWATWMLWIGLACLSFGLSRIMSRYTTRWMLHRRASRERKQDRILSEPPTRRSR